MGRVCGYLFFFVDLYIVRIMLDELFYVECWVLIIFLEFYVYCFVCLLMFGLKIGGDGMRIVVDEV